MRRRLQRRLGRSLALALALLCCAPAWADAPPTEYQVKAAYLFNFGQFVEWPAQAWSSPAAPFGICVVGSDPFGTMLDDVTRGEALGGRPLQVRRFASASEISGCQILFIGRSESGRIEATLQALQGRSVLTVTDIEGADKYGAMIVLRNDNQHIRMRINLAAARASHLVISSKLLRPAEVVGNDAD
jgi:YfiR/HmsC-like